ncbi:serine/threonine-protein kinase [Streptantibioticus ferralitis]|uniref:non-specific serine/threonine protein kinase n=1 Tax=Streptantibioticus ferralitis TaxID=236510 RepID=A0ABT5Z3C0_9ACTN|nr:serine/threonine-protein kinase [Streptantibioticus ferralitis]MDF2258321.1 tetratricopeptide repeat protein [Streptantibioticus ferralitis]
MKCGRPGCDGTLEDVGGGELYCDTCGLAPVAGNGAGAGGTGSSAAAVHSAPSSGASVPSSRTSGATSSRSSSSRRSVSGRLSGVTSGRSVSVRSSRSGSSGSARGKLGAGLVSVPTIPPPDPRAAVLANPEVPERKRYCSKCEAQVGRSRGDRPGRTEGFCTKCGNPYSFSPKLRAGDVVHGQYEVVGCLAHGGLGWIYLAVDRAVSDRWVVLKGLLDTGDEDALAAAVSERRFLAEIEHPNIVRIYNFVEHLDQRTGTLDGYIVMEYVGGKSLKEIANDRRAADGRREPLPVDQAIAYGIEALEALGHLHSRNLLYCDFKVDNAIQQEDRLKLIDMGAVRRMDDMDSPIYGTIGYQAPEVAEVGPSVASDLYTVARTLAVLTFDFQGYTNVFADSLPDPEHIEVFSRYESFYRLLVRATDPDPGRRFASADEMGEQLTGVLREVVALRTGKPRPSLSTLFGPELRVVDTGLVAPREGEVSSLGARPLPAGRGGLLRVPRQRRPAAGANGASAPGRLPTTVGVGAPTSAGGAAPGGTGPAAQGSTAPGQLPSTAEAESFGPDSPHMVTARGGTGLSAQGPGGIVAGLDAHAAALALPVPLVDPGDPNAGFLAGLLAAAPAELIAALAAAPTDSVEKRLRELRARLEMGDRSNAAHALTALQEQHPDDWRVVWYRGLWALTEGDHESAALAFDAIYDAFPGESAPKLALGICAEVLGQLDNAAEYYGLVWTTDQAYVSAAFGLARVRLAAGDRPAAVRALESVPESSIHYTAARVATVRARLRARSAQDPLLDDLTAASAQVEKLGALGLDAVRREELATEVLGSALDWVLAGRHGTPSGTVQVALLGNAAQEQELRFGLERSYRVLARLAQRGEERIELVERANRFRPRTWV